MIDFGIFEILNVTDKIKSQIMDGMSSIQIKEEAVKEGYKPLLIEGIRKVLEGITTLDELNSKLLFY